MFSGIIYVISACFFWGLIFVVPQMMEGYSSLEVAVSRYLFYGLFSVGLIGFCRKQELKQLNSSIWLRAFWFGLLANVLYYPCLVCSIRYATPVIATLIFGLSPIAISIFGNWKRRECRYEHLILPALCILIGLVLVNWRELHNSMIEGSLQDYLLGITSGVIAVGLWTYYAVANADFLKRHPQISSLTWSTVVGIATLGWIAIILAYSIGKQGLDHTLRQYIISNSHSFVIGGLILGILSTWVGIYCWNKGSSRLPVSFAGQLTVFETIFGLLFVFILEGRYPSATEFSGAALMLSGVIMSIHTFKTASAAEAH